MRSKLETNDTYSVFGPTAYGLAGESKKATESTTTTTTTTTAAAAAATTTTTTTPLWAWLG